VDECKPLGLGIPIFFVQQENRDKERLEAGKVPDCLLIVYQFMRSTSGQEG
jgi:hypothetical protein